MLIFQSIIGLLTRTTRWTEEKKKHYMMSRAKLKGDTKMNMLMNILEQIVAFVKVGVYIGGAVALLCGLHIIRKR